MTTFFDNGIATLYQADARQIPAADRSVHCVVTSPPYFGLRVYRVGFAQMGEPIGLEPSPQEYLTEMMQVMAEVRRVLRDDGVLWVNLADSYGRNPKKGGSGVGGKEERYMGDMYRRAQSVHQSATDGQLLGMPDAFKNAMKDVGWIHRSTVIWEKKSAKPESLNGTRWERCRVKGDRIDVDWPERPKNWQAGEGSHDEIPDGNYRQNGGESTVAEWVHCPGCPKCAGNDGLVLRHGSWRCTSSHEYIFQFVKKMNYYSDGEAVKTFDGSGWHARSFTNERDQERDASLPNPRLGLQERFETAGANRRSVWSDIKPEPFGGEHYATYPSDLPRLCIQASTSEVGVCAECGAQWARVIERGDLRGDLREAPQREGRSVRAVGDYQDDGYREEGGNLGLTREIKTLSWRPTCACNAGQVPATVLDPFVGTGTTCLAAMRLGRRSVGVDLSADYLNMAIKRLSGETLPLGV